MYISDLDTTGTDRSGAIIRYDDTSGTDRATIYLPGPATGGNVSITVTDNITDNTTWLTIPVSFTSGGLPANNENRNVIGVRNGVQGLSGSAAAAAAGSTGQLTYNYNGISSGTDYVIYDTVTGIITQYSSTTAYYTEISADLSLGQIRYRNGNYPNASVGVLAQPYDGGTSISGYYAVGITSDSTAGIDVQGLAPSSILGIGTNIPKTFINADSFTLSAAITNPGSFDDFNVRGKSYFDGNVGIGTINPQIKLDLNGDLRILGALYDSSSQVGVGGSVLVSTVTGVKWDSPPIINRTVGVSIDGGGSAVTTGTKGYVEVPYAGTITGWKIISDVSGSAVFDVWKSNAAIPTNANTITASAKPTLTASQRAASTTLTGWTTGVAVNDVFGFEVESASTITKATLILVIRQT